MALRSALPFHNQWPNINAPTDLPNDPASPTQSNSLEIGDICYDESGQTYYYCTDATLGAAVWVAFGASGPPAPDHQSHYIIVGNALAGDSASVCNFLDPGDGTGISAALAAAALLTPPVDVYVRPGVYTLVSPLTVTEGVRLLGAGRGRTRIVGFIDAPSINVACRGTEVCDLDVTAVNTFGVFAMGGIIDVRFQGTTTIPADPFALRRLSITLGASFIATPTSPLSAIFMGVGSADYYPEGNAIEDVNVVVSGQLNYLAGTNIADRTAGLRASLVATTSPPVWPRVNITNFCVQDLEACTILDGVNGAHRTCQYDGLALATWTPQPGQQVGFYATGAASESTYDFCEARISIPTSYGFNFDGDAVINIDSFALNSCSVYYEPATLGAGGVGFRLNTPTVNDPLVGVRMYCNFVETASIGYELGQFADNTVAIGNGTISVSTPVLDSGSFNDFGHLQAN